MIVNDVLFSPEAVKTNVSAATTAFPAAESVPLSAGPAPKLLQPSPPPAGGLPHGQMWTPPSPGRQNAVSGEALQPARSIRLQG